MYGKLETFNSVDFFELGFYFSSCLNFGSRGFKLVLKLYPFNYMYLNYLFIFVIYIFNKDSFRI